jgi:hypothetical protein
MTFGECSESADIDECEGALEGDGTASGWNFFRTLGAHTRRRGWGHRASSVGVGFLGSSGIIRHDPLTMTQIESSSLLSFRKYLVKS